jgi:hypothetical protein
LPVIALTALCDNPQEIDFYLRPARIFVDSMQLARRLLVLIGGMGLAGTLAWPQAPPPFAPRPPVSMPIAGPPLVLAGATVVDVSDWGHSAKDLPDAIVIVRDGRITDVGSRMAVSIPKGARVIDCTGKYLIPGLVDGYAGMNSQGQANAFLYMGVTTVAARNDDGHGSIDFAVNPGPHIYPVDSIGTTDNWSLLGNTWSGHLWPRPGMLSGGGPNGDPDWAVTLREGNRPVELSPEDTARQMIGTARLSTRVLWLGHNLTAANTQWIIARAHQMGLVTYGEFISTPYKVGLEAGVDVLLHMGRYELGVIPDELQRPLVEDSRGSAASTAYDYSERLPPTDLHLSAYARFLATHHAALMPTFSRYYIELPDHRNLWKEPAASLLDPARLSQPPDRSTGDPVYPLSYWARRLPAIGQRYVEESLRKKAEQSALRLWRFNQTIFSFNPHYLAASGSPEQGSMPGISMHTELELLVRLGVSPREALAAATNNYALQFGWNELGLIAPGRRADILVVDGDPTVNIWNARRISMLIMDGNVLDRDGLLNLKR